VPSIDLIPNDSSIRRYRARFCNTLFIKSNSSLPIFLFSPSPGSGKTGLCIALLEETAIDGIPAIIIDPKGDLANLMLTFPDLKSDDFAPWVNEEDAQKKNLSTADYATQQAELWTKGSGRLGRAGGRGRRQVHRARAGAGGE
jgi:hypothetical protein